MIPGIAGPRPPSAELVRMVGIHRRFGRVVALQGADLSLTAGEVHAVLGENGAGKSTLLGVLAGLVRPDAGSVLVDGAPVRFRSARDAGAFRIGLVHQHFSLVPAFSVLENLALGAWTGRVLPLERVRAHALGLMERTGLEVDLDARTATLGVGERQRVEILRALAREPRVLALDEPTAVLAPPEVERLFALLSHLAEGGMTVVLVGHKLDEVLSVAERVTVLRDGRTVLTAPRADVDAPRLVRAMVGEEGTSAATELTIVEGRRDPSRAVAARRGGPVAPGEVVARLEGVEVGGEGARIALAGVDLEVRQGEIVGIAGVEGNGQRELALVLAGRMRPRAGRVLLPPAIGFIPQDRSREGLIADFTLTENLALALHRDPAFRSGVFLRWRALAARARDVLADYAVKAPGPGARARQLSGGNQQRVVVARELGLNPDLVVAENPTRGLDVSAAAFVHRRLRAHPAVVLVSSDLDEVLRLSDRVLVMLRGRLIPVPAEERSRRSVGRMMLADGPAPAGDGAALGDGVDA